MLQELYFKNLISKSSARSNGLKTFKDNFDVDIFKT